MITTVFTSLVFSLLFANENLSNYKNVEKTNPKPISKHISLELKDSKRGNYYYVTAYRAYFYSGPNYSSITKKFLVNGDVCEVLKYKNGFGYVIYYNPHVNKTTSGWLDLNDIESNR